MHAVRGLKSATVRSESVTVSQTRREEHFQFVTCQCEWGGVVQSRGRQGKLREREQTKTVTDAAVKRREEQRRGSER